VIGDATCHGFAGRQSVDEVKLKRIIRVRIFRGDECYVSGTLMAIHRQARQFIPEADLRDHFFG
jgi:hypothetical protein